MDDLAGQSPEEAASASEAPAAAGLDIETIRQEAIKAANAAAEERFKGFQRVIAEKDTALGQLQKQLEEARLSSLSDEEREEEIQKQTGREVDRLRAENELLRLMPEYPEELPVFQRLLAAPDAKTQLQLLRDLKAAAAPAKKPDPSPEMDPASVDLNNPASAPAGLILGDGTPMTDDLADRLLRSSSRLR